ncbi:hypothetical protein STEG23_029516 [Scotinomys teguina]
MEFRAAGGDAFTYDYTSDTVFKTRGKDRCIGKPQNHQTPGDISLNKERESPGENWKGGVTPYIDKECEFD